MVRAIIRAWDVDQLQSAAQFNSIWKTLDEDQRAGLEKALPKGKKLSEKGFKDAPAVKYKDGRRVLGGILVRGPIQRDVTINLVALRGLYGGEQTDALRKYLLALSILSATADIELFLREGCHLRYADDADRWCLVPRRGKNSPIDLVSDESRKVVLGYANAAYKPFKKKWEELDLGSEHEFDLKAAKDLLGKTTDEEAGDE